MIFLHGWGGSTDSFLGVAKNIRNYRITLIDFYGFGNTPHPDYPLCLDDFINGVKEIITFYNMDEVVLCAHSFGGRVAIKLASENPKYLKKIVLVDSAGIPPKRGLKYKFKIFTYKFFKALKINLNFGSADYKSLDGAMKKTFVNIVNEDLTEYLQYISVPTLIVWGDKDVDTPLYMAKKLNEKIKDSGLVILHGTHFCYIECLNEFILILNSFLGAT